MHGAVPNKFSLEAHLQLEAAKAIEGWDEKKSPMPTRIVITVSKKSPRLPAMIGNVFAVVKVDPQA